MLGDVLESMQGLAMVEGSTPVTNKWINAGQWEVDIAGQRYPCKVSLAPMYDAKNVKIKA